MINKEQALDKVSFPVERFALNFNKDNQIIQSGREALVRTDTAEPTILGYVSPDYQIISHRDALSSAYEALDKLGVGYDLARLDLDRGGGKMFAQFKVDKNYQITDAKGDVLNPVLTLVNGIDGLSSLTWMIESIRLVCLNLAKSNIRDIQHRFIHTGNNDSSVLLNTAKDSLIHFEDKLIPFYKQMAQIEVSKDLAEKAVVAAVKEKAIPIKVAKFATHCVTSDRASEEGIKRTMWALYNGFTWASTRKGEEMGASRHNEIRNNIAKLFKDGGQDLLNKAREVKAEEVVDLVRAA